MSTSTCSPCRFRSVSKDSWLAVEFPEKDPLMRRKPFGITRDTLVDHRAWRDGVQAGWRSADCCSTNGPKRFLRPSENTGISFRFNQPNAVPPQSAAARGHARGDRRVETGTSWSASSTTRWRAPNAAPWSPRSSKRKSCSSWNVTGAGHRRGVQHGGAGRRLARPIARGRVRKARRRLLRSVQKT